MYKLLWDETGQREYETGIKNAVLYPRNSDGSYPKGYVWNGITGVTESPSGAEPTDLYADDIKYMSLTSAETVGATIEAYMYPDEFKQCDGSAEIAAGVVIGQQKRTAFGMSYKTTLGNDVDGDDFGYKIHLLYGATASPSEKAYASKNDSPEAVTFSWEVTTNPINIDGFKPTASILIDSTKAKKDKLAALESILYGKAAELTKTQPEDWNTNYKNYVTKKSDGTYEAITQESAPAWAENTYYVPEVDARLPLPNEIIEIMAEG